MKRFPADIIAFMLLALFANAFMQETEAATCSSISRSSFGANTILTSSELNSQFSTVYSAANDLDGGCVTDGTLEAAALNAADFQPLLNNVVSGCLISKSSASAISIGPCSMSINGKMVNKTGSTIVSMGCSGCSVEIADRAYYVYIKGDSSGSTINTLITYTAPDTLGYSGTNKVVGRFYNDTGSDIDEYSTDQWAVNEFKSKETGRINTGAIVLTAAGTDPTKGTVIKDTLYFTRLGEYALLEFDYHRSSIGAVAGTSYYIIDLPIGLTFEEYTYTTSSAYPDGTQAAPAYGPIFISGQNGGWPQNGSAMIVPYTATQFRLYIWTSVNTNGNVISGWNGLYVQGGFNDTTDAMMLKGSAMIPIKNWSY